MNLSEKEAMVEQVGAVVLQAPLVVLTDFQGATVAEIMKLRRTVTAAGMSFQVVKNSLARRAIAGSDREGLAPHFKGNTVVICSGEDAVAAAKLLKTELKDKEKFKVRVGFFDGAVLDPKGVEGVAELPSREQLLANLLGLLQEGPRQLVSVIQAPARDLVNVLSNYASKLESAE